MPDETQVSELDHLDRKWRIVKIDGKYFARDDKDVDHGPHDGEQEARDWVEAIRP